MKEQISSIVNCDQKEINGNLYFYWLDKSVKLALSTIAELERIGIIVSATATFYYFINTSYCK